MQNSSAEQSTVNKTTVTKRYWKRLEEPSGGWWPWGWVPLLGLLLTFLYGAFFTADKMEEDTQARVASALMASGHSGFDVKADGQWVNIAGKGPESLRPQIESIARGAACDTWIAKDLICATRVNVDLTQVKAAAPKVAAAPKPQPKPVAAPKARYHDVQFVSDKSGLTLEGEVPSDEVRKQLVTKARALSSRVTDKLSVSNEKATVNYPWATGQMFNLLPRLRNGGFAWKQGRLSGWGLVDADAEANVRAGFASTQDRRLLGDLRLQVVPSAVSCNQKFAAVLASATIQFRTSKADINPASQPLLQRLATLAKECPIRLDVEGHTDSRGPEEMNLAVAGRAKNRRIEIKASGGQ